MTSGHQLVLPARPFAGQVACAGTFGSQPCCLPWEGGAACTASFRALTPCLVTINVRLERSSLLSPQRGVGGTRRLVQCALSTCCAHTARPAWARRDRSCQVVMKPDPVLMSPGAAAPTAQLCPAWSEAAGPRCGVLALPPRTRPPLASLAGSRPFAVHPGLCPPHRGLSFALSALSCCVALQCPDGQRRAEHVLRVSALCAAFPDGGGKAWSGPALLPRTPVTWEGTAFPSFKQVCFSFTAPQSASLAPGGGSIPARCASVPPASDGRGHCGAVPSPLPTSVRTHGNRWKSFSVSSVCECV